MRETKQITDISRNPRMGFEFQHVAQHYRSLDRPISSTERLRTRHGVIKIVKQKAEPKNSILNVRIRAANESRDPNRSQRPTLSARELQNTK